MTIATGLILVLAVALWAFSKKFWHVVAALAGHGLFDLRHARLINDPAVPIWWAMLRLGYDVIAALYRAWRTRTRLAGMAPSLPRALATAAR